MIWKAQTWNLPCYIFKTLNCWPVEYEVILEGASQKSCIIGRNAHWGLPNIKQPSHIRHYVRIVRKSTQLLLLQKTLFSLTQKLPHVATPHVHHQAGMCSGRWGKFKIILHPHSHTTRFPLRRFSDQTLCM